MPCFDNYSIFFLFLNKQFFSAHTFIKGNYWIITEYDLKNPYHVIAKHKAAQLGAEMKMFFSQSSRINHTLSEQELERNALLSDLEKTKKALEIAYAGFDNVTEPDLIDCYIYEVNSVLKRYKFLMEQAALLNMLPEEKEYPSPLHTETPATSLIG